MNAEPVTILLVDDHPAKLLSYETILGDLGENLVKLGSAKEALSYLIKSEVAVILMDVCMPDLDGFELAAMIRQHPKHEKTAIIFISGVRINEADLIKGYETGAVDYVPVPIVPAILRAKVRIFVDLYRKTKQLKELNEDLELRVQDRTRALTESTERLRRSEEHLRLASEAARFASYQYDRTAGEMQWSANIGELLYGASPGRQSLESALGFIHPDDRGTFRQYMIDTDSELPERHEFEFRVADPRGRVRWLLDRGQAFDSSAASDSRARVLGTLLDITDRREAEEHQQLLMAELDHRVKNILANVTAIARLSSANAASVSHFVQSLEGRIYSMSAAHDLLRQSSWQGTDFNELVQSALLPFSLPAETNVTIEGEPVRLAAKAAQSFALVLHELATNAVKHGALSATDGRVKISWQKVASGPSGSLRFVWREQGGPEVREPQRRGFGLTVLKTAAYDSGGTADLMFAKDGFEFRLDRPLELTSSRVTDGKTIDRSTTFASTCSPARLEPKRGGNALACRILLVEDEPFIAMQLQSDLEGDGHEVVGPACTLAEGIELANRERFDIALLDVNLGRQNSAPIADVLLRREVPFAFATGFNDLSLLPEHLRSTPRLSKPYMIEEIRQLVRMLSARQAA